MKKRVLQEWNEIRKWWREGYRIRISTAKRLAVAVLIFIAMCFGCVLSIEGVRTSIRDAVVEWYQTFVTVAFVRDEVIEAPVEIADPEVVAAYKEPVIGAEYLRTEIYRDETKLMIEYSKDDMWITYDQRIFVENNVYISNNTSWMREILINGNQGYWVEVPYEFGFYTEIVWSDSTSVYWISSNQSVYDLITIAESIK